jgi:lysophospholipase
MIEKRAENIMIPEEANYQRTMKRDVEPYLRSYEKDGKKGFWLEVIGYY